MQSLFIFFIILYLLKLWFVTTQCKKKYYLFNNNILYIVHNGQNKLGTHIDLLSIFIFILWHVDNTRIPIFDTKCIQTYQFLLL